jgi:hypothetical protein
MKSNNFFEFKIKKSKHDKKVREAVSEIIDQFAKLMEVDPHYITEFDFLDIYDFVDFIISYKHMSLAVEHNLNFDQFSDWYCNYYLTESMSLDWYIKNKIG